MVIGGIYSLALSISILILNLNILTLNYYTDKYLEILYKITLYRKTGAKIIYDFSARSEGISAAFMV